MGHPRVVAALEITYAIAQALLAYYVPRGLAAAGRPVPAWVEVAAWAPAGAAVLLAALVGRPWRWPWWPAAGLAAFVVVDAGLALLGIARVPAARWPGAAAWAIVGFIGVKFAAQLAVLVAAIAALRLPAAVPARAA